jgi:hypothetical protein
MPSPQYGQRQKEETVEVVQVHNFYIGISLLLQAVCVFFNVLTLPAFADWDPSGMFYFVKMTSFPFTQLFWIFISVSHRVDVPLSFPVILSR